MKVRLLVASIWTASLVGSVAATLAAQRLVHPAGGTPEVVAGPDVGFRINTSRGDTPVGELVIKRDGQWVPVEFDSKIRPAR